MGCFACALGGAEGVGAWILVGDVNAGAATLGADAGRTVTVRVVKFLRIDFTVRACSFGVV